MIGTENAEAGSDCTAGENKGQNSANNASGKKPRAGRVVSVDALRGLTVLGMLLVNNAAMDTATPSQFIHAGWNKGLHFADMIFPWFLFLTGLSIPYSAAARGGPFMRELRMFRRTAALLFLGFAVDSSVAGRITIGLGVLQLIGLAYLAGAVLYDLPAARRAYIAAGLLAAHWAAIRYIPFPGAAAGTFTESQNLIKHINDMYLEPVGLRGLVSVAPASALAIIGSLAGDVLRAESYSRALKSVVIFAAGAALAGMGLLWNLSLPFNKPLWTAPYIVFSAGTAMLILGLFFLVFDTAGFSSLAFPLTVFGANALATYVIPIFTKMLILNRWIVTDPAGVAVSAQQALFSLYFGSFGRIAGGWMYTLSFILFWWCVMVILYRKKWFLRV